MSELSPVNKAIEINGVVIDDTFAEAFGMSGSSLIITADSIKWARICATVMTGFGTSVIGCGAECGIDCELSPNDTPDGRPGVRVLMFGFSPDALTPQVKNRVGQCVLTSPGSACYNGLLGTEQKIALASGVKFFGDGNQTSKKLGNRRFWRIPVMDGEFICEDTVGLTTEAVGGGNMLILGRERKGLLEATEAAVDAIAQVPDVITPFPGGIVRSGSKVGAKYKGMFASTNDAFAPTLRAISKSELSEDTIAVLEVVIDGLTSEAVSNAMRAGLKAVIDIGASKGVTRISAGNYGGKLGQHHYHLQKLVPQ